MKRCVFATLLTVFVSPSLRAQCSDAGVCSIGRPASSAFHSLSVSYGFGVSGKPDSLTFHTIEISGNVEVIPGGRISVTLPVNSQAGPLGSTSGIGDLMVMWQQTLGNDEDVTIAAEIGARIALANVNAGNLPQAYQSGLGTNDLLVGVRCDVSDWNFALAYQRSRGRSENKVTRLMRGDDILVRAGYTTQIGAVELMGELLAIKRLDESNVLISTIGKPESFGTIPGSDQAQVNLVARGSLPVADNMTVGLMAALPLLQRNVNIDGLKRALALSTGLTFNL